jgi:hypothetical protein
VLLFCQQANASLYVLGKDSTILQTKVLKYRIIPRISTKGFFAYTGLITTNNIVADIQVRIEKNNVGVLLLKAQDLTTNESNGNYGAAFIFRKMAVSRKLNVTPYLGFFAVERNSIADSGSDVAVIIENSLLLAPGLVFDNAMIFGGLAITGHYNWTNRFRLMYSTKHITSNAFICHNNMVFDETGYLSTGASVGLVNLKVADKVSVGLSATFVGLLYSNSTERFPIGQDFFFTFSITFNN